MYSKLLVLSLMALLSIGKIWAVDDAPSGVSKAVKVPALHVYPAVKQAVLEVYADLDKVNAANIYCMEMIINIGGVSTRAETYTIDSEYSRLLNKWLKKRAEMKAEIAKLMTTKRGGLKGISNTKVLFSTINGLDLSPKEKGMMRLTETTFYKTEGTTQYEFQAAMTPKTYFEFMKSGKLLIEKLKTQVYEVVSNALIDIIVLEYLRKTKTIRDSMKRKSDEDRLRDLRESKGITADKLATLTSIIAAMGNQIKKNVTGLCFNTSGQVPDAYITKATPMTKAFEQYLYPIPAFQEKATDSVNSKLVTLGRIMWMYKSWFKKSGTEGKEYFADVEVLFQKIYAKNKAAVEACFLVWGEYSDIVMKAAIMVLKPALKALPAPKKKRRKKRKKKKKAPALETSEVKKMILTVRTEEQQLELDHKECWRTKQKLEEEIEQVSKEAVDLMKIRKQELGTLESSSKVHLTALERRVPHFKKMVRKHQKEVNKLRKALKIAEREEKREKDKAVEEARLARKETKIDAEEAALLAELAALED